MSSPPSWCPFARPVPSLALTTAALFLISQPCVAFFPMPIVPSLPQPPSLFFSFCPPLPHPRPHAGSVTSRSSKHQEMKWPGPSILVAQGPMASVGGHPGPVGYQSIFAEHSSFLRKGSCPALSPHQPRLGSAARPVEGSRHNDFAEAVGRERTSPTMTLVPLPLWGDSKCAPKSVLARDLGWAWRDRRSTGFYSVNAFYGVTESSEGAKEVLKECMEKPAMRQSWGVALAGAVSQTGDSYELRQGCPAGQQDHGKAGAGALGLAWKCHCIARDAKLCHQMLT